MSCNVSDVTIDQQSIQMNESQFIWSNTMPPKFSTNTSAGKQPSKSNSKKNRSNPTPSYESVQKMIKDSKIKHGKLKNTTDNYDGNVRRGKEFIAAFVKDRLDKPKVVTQMERILWTPTSIKPLLVHQLNVHLLPLPCSLHMFYWRMREVDSICYPCCISVLLWYYVSWINSNCFGGNFTSLRYQGPGKKFHGQWHFV